MDIKLNCLTPNIVQLWLELKHIPSPEEKKDLEDKLQDYALTHIAVDRRGRVYSDREHDMVGIVLISEEDLTPF